MEAATAFEFFVGEDFDAGRADFRFHGVEIRSIKHD